MGRGEPGRRKGPACEWRSGDGCRVGGLQATGSLCEIPRVLGLGGAVEQRQMSTVLCLWSCEAALGSSELHHSQAL